MTDEKRPRRVLIIDDDKDLAEMVGTLLGKAGVDYHICPSAEEGLEQARFFSPDLIWLDVMMHGIHGLQALRQLRTHADTARTAIIIVSSMPPEEIEAEAADYNAEFVKKAPAPDLAALIKRKLGVL